MIDRDERDCLHALMTYRFFVGDDLRLQRALRQGVSHEQLARAFEEDAQLMQDVDWLDKELAEALGMPEANRVEFELTLPTEALGSVLKRAAKTPAPASLTV